MFPSQVSGGQRGPILPPAYPETSPTPAGSPFLDGPGRSDPAEISGRVTGRGNGLPGGGGGAGYHNRKSSADADGNFTIVPGKMPRPLVFSSHRFHQPRGALTAATVYNVTMCGWTSGLDEVVVIGYGTTTRRERPASDRRESGGM